MNYKNLRYTPELEDAVQEAELIYLEKGLELEFADKSRWISATAKNLMKNYDRKNSHYIFLDFNDTEDSEFNLIDILYFNYYDIENKVTFQQLLELLEPLDVSILTLYLDGFTHNEIANNLEISINTSRQRISRIIRNLKETIIKR